MPRRLFFVLVLASPAAWAAGNADPAIRRGVAWLRSQQSADGSFGSQPGRTALALLAFFIAIGFCYRASAALFFVGFTLSELWDVTNYLNHHYLIALLARRTDLRRTAAGRAPGGGSGAEQRAIAYP